MPNKALVKFIKEARKRGFDDFQIREPLLKSGWPFDKIEEAFSSLKPRHQYKNKLSIFLDSQILKLLEKRAKKNLLTIPEQVEDILRRSCLSKKKPKEEKLDDLLVSLFSRKKS